MCWKALQSFLLYTQNTGSNNQQHSLPCLLYLMATGLVAVASYYCRSLAEVILNESVLVEELQLSVTRHKFMGAALDV